MNKPKTWDDVVQRSSELWDALDEITPEAVLPERPAYNRAKSIIDELNSLYIEWFHSVSIMFNQEEIRQSSFRVERALEIIRKYAKEVYSIPIPHLSLPPKPSALRFPSILVELYSKKDIESARQILEKYTEIEVSKIYYRHITLLRCCLASDRDIPIKVINELETDLLKIGINARYCMEGSDEALEHLFHLNRHVFCCRSDPCSPPYSTQLSFNDRDEIFKDEKGLISLLSEYQVLLPGRATCCGVNSISGFWKDSSPIFTPLSKKDIYRTTMNAKSIIDQEMKRMQHILDEKGGLEEAVNRLRHLPIVVDSCAKMAWWGSEQSAVECQRSFLQKVRFNEEESEHIIAAANKLASEEDLNACINRYLEGSSRQNIPINIWHIQPLDCWVKREQLPELSRIFILLFDLPKRIISLRRKDPSGAFSTWGSPMPV